MKIKKFLAIIFLFHLLLSLSGCDEYMYRDHKFITCSKREKLLITYENLSSSLSIYSFEYNGHKYIEVDIEKTSNVLHDPDCHCLKKNKEENHLSIDY